MELSFATLIDWKDGEEGGEGGSEVFQSVGKPIWTNGTAKREEKRASSFVGGMDQDRIYRGDVTFFPGGAPPPSTAAAARACPKALAPPSPKGSACVRTVDTSIGGGQFRCGPLFSFPSDLMAGCPDSRPSDRRANGGGMGGGKDCCALRDRQRGEEEGGKEERVCWERGRRGHLLAITRPPRPQAASAAAPGGWGNIFPKVNAPAGVPPGRSARFRRNGQKMQHTWVGVRTRMGRPPLALPPSSPRPSARQPADWRGRRGERGGFRGCCCARTYVRTSVLLFLFFPWHTYSPRTPVCKMQSLNPQTRMPLASLSLSPFPSVRTTDIRGRKKGKCPECRRRGGRGTSSLAVTTPQKWEGPSVWKEGDKRERGTRARVRFCYFCPLSQLSPPTPTPPLL